MYTVQLSNLNFKATILGNGFKEIKDMSIVNGLSNQEVLEAENRIHAAFPLDTLHISSSFNSEKAKVNIILKKKNPKNSFMNFSINRTFEIATSTDEQVKNLLISLAEIVEEMSKKFGKFNNEPNPKKPCAAS